jgi:hypothetical protein
LYLIQNFPPSFAPVKREQELGLELRARRVENGIYKKGIPHLFIAPFLIAFFLQVHRYLR